jgi:hypothetical protein
MNYPDKIYDWQHTQLSIARFYGGITIGGDFYYIDEADPRKPLVRQKLSKREKSTRKIEQLKNKLQSIF